MNLSLHIFIYICRRLDSSVLVRRLPLLGSFPPFVVDLDGAAQALFQERQRNFKADEERLKVPTLRIVKYLVSESPCQYSD